MLAIVRIAFHAQQTRIDDVDQIIGSRRQVEVVVVGDQEPRSMLRRIGLADRLQQVTRGIESPDEAIARVGNPDFTVRSSRST